MRFPGDAAMRLFFALLWLIGLPRRMRREVLRSIKQHRPWKRAGFYTTLD